jgi:hypothetical protein
MLSDVGSHFEHFFKRHPGCVLKCAVAGRALQPSPDRPKPAIK